VPGDYEPVRSRYLDVGGIRTTISTPGTAPVVLLHSGEFGGSAGAVLGIQYRPAGQGTSG
jgi:hypothetical protein